MDHQAFAQLLGNYGEFVGAIAVVLTLVYLAAQVKHGKAALDANTQAMEREYEVKTHEAMLSLGLLSSLEAASSFENTSWRISSASISDVLVIRLIYCKSLPSYRR